MPEIFWNHTNLAPRPRHQHDTPHTTAAPAPPPHALHCGARKNASAGRRGGSVAITWHRSRPPAGVHFPEPPRTMPGPPPRPVTTLTARTADRHCVVGQRGCRRARSRRPPAYLVSRQVRKGTMTAERTTSSPGASPSRSGSTPPSCPDDRAPEPRPGRLGRQQGANATLSTPSALAGEATVAERTERTRGLGAFPGRQPHRLRRLALLRAQADELVGGGGEDCRPVWHSGYGGIAPSSAAHCRPTTPGRTGVPSRCRRATTPSSNPCWPN